MEKPSNPAWLDKVVAATKHVVGVFGLAGEFVEEVKKQNFPTEEQKHGDDDH